MLMLKNDLLYDESKEVVDYQDCFRKAVKVKEWLKNKKAYAIAFNQLGLSLYWRSSKRVDSVPDRLVL